MNKILSLLFVLISVNSFAQITFEKGYFIDNENSKIDCLIRNIDWLNNPDKIEYKLTENGDRKTAVVNQIKEFGVGDVLFKRFTVQIERLELQIEKLTNYKNPQFKEETLLLKQIEKGDVNLYMHIDGNSTIFFFDSNDFDITQLYYKKYLKAKNLVGVNNMFRQQLLNVLDCTDISIVDVKNLGYSKKQLSKLFKKYNICKGVYEKESETKIKKKDFFNLNLRLGANSTMFKIPSRGITNPSPYEFDFGSIIGFQVGLEAEYILPFNKNKWAIIAEPTYNSFKSESISLNYLPETATLKYNTFELPIGLRHYLFINNSAKLFINVSHVLIFDINSDFSTQRPGFDFHKGVNTSVGLGFNYKNSFSLEFRYDTHREVFELSNGFTTEFDSFSVILGGTLF